MAFYSKKLNPAECNYSVYDKELLAIYRACMHWHCYLDCRSTTVYTDHKPLTLISTSGHPSRRATNWIDKLSDLSLQIVHHPGPLNIVADSLSKVPERTRERLVDEDLARVSRWLVKVAPHCNVHVCGDAVYTALAAGRSLGFIHCKYCSAAHLDSGAWSTKVHTRHTC